MRIIQLIQKPQLRGAEIFACQLSNHLNNKHEVLVVTIFKGDAKLPFNGNIQHLNRPLGKRFFDLEGWKEFNTIIKKFQPDIIQANAADTLKFAVSSKIVYSWKVPIVFRNANKMGDFINSKIKFYLNKFYLKKISYVISVSKECQKDFEKTFKWPSNNITTVEIGVEEKTYGEIPSDLDFIYKKGRVLCHIGGFAPEKNHLGLLNIFGKVKAQFPDLQLLLIGKGRLEDEVREEVKNLKLDDCVHFLGYRNDVLEILSSSQIFVLPSLIEGLPAVILESMYCETPVVAYNVGGIREVVISGETGWLVTKNDEEGFVESLLEILTNQSKIKKRVSQAKLMVSKNFMNKVIADKFLDCYKYVSKQT
ncbi:glycosyltransferase family 4 protein [Salegentibacter mishustinae]|uniref:Glycosyl transferase family 1 n=1 Tax=Salegentibacter mishustinae TaxID=270918 RepID=A0A0Q9Z878_9FLAO|nr:glycosyltransferase family 4 protein [Salegentibacter mishustinae]KRG29173.1 hypothetical protein APR42_04375 [Salegentibacter mishustinae]PNW21775.1 hypothetical protein APB85_11110 [Salegentibacter mishustinae]GGW87208.1 hypothetical protein GCM10008086_14640 [Salegentibacter mishustinae]